MFKSPSPNTLMLALGIGKKGRSTADTEWSGLRVGKCPTPNALPQDSQVYEQRARSCPFRRFIDPADPRPRRRLAPIPQWRNAKCECGFSVMPDGSSRCLLDRGLPKARPRLLNSGAGPKQGRAVSSARKSIGERSNGKAVCSSVLGGAQCARQSSSQLARVYGLSGRLFRASLRSPIYAPPNLDHLAY